MKGYIKTFVPQKEYGFIKGDDNKDYFFHNNNLKDKKQANIICDNMAVTFEQKATPKGYSAINIVVDNSKKEFKYSVPDTVYLNKQNSIKGWEILQSPNWIINGTSKKSPDMAEQDLIDGAKMVGANAVLNKQYYKTTGQDGNYFYTIHNFKGQIAIIGKRDANGKYKKYDFIDLDKEASKVKSKLLGKTDNAKSKRFVFWLNIFRLCQY